MQFQKLEREPLQRQQAYVGIEYILPNNAISSVYTNALKNKEILVLFSPSPGHKLPRGGTRNELFLRSVLSSPYNHDIHSYTPMSATPAGISPRPVFKTPVTNDNGSPLTHRTPKGEEECGAPIQGEQFCILMQLFCTQHFDWLMH